MSQAVFIEAWNDYLNSWQRLQDISFYGIHPFPNGNSLTSTIPTGLGDLKDEAQIEKLENERNVQKDILTKKFIAAVQTVLDTDHLSSLNELDRENFKFRLLNKIK